jgi:hypothetical protein
MIGRREEEKKCCCRKKGKEREEWKEKSGETGFIQIALYQAGFEINESVEIFGSMNPSLLAQ